MHCARCSKLPVNVSVSCHDPSTPPDTLPPVAWTVESKAQYDELMGVIRETASEQVPSSTVQEVGLRTNMIEFAVD